MSQKTQNDGGYCFYIDKTLEKLMNLSYGDRIKLKYKDLLAIAYVSKSIFMKESMLLEVSAPIKICGDIHGQYCDLQRIFELCGYPPDTRYLFLGDYVDRGTFSLECICLLLCLKIKYPNNFYLLRGNHETEALNRIYGFREEIKSRFGSSKVWKAFLKMFNSLPIAAVIENSIFCCHGGLSPDLLDDSVISLRDAINAIERPSVIALDGLMCDLLWSDPTDIDDPDDPPEGWEENDRGCSWTFGFDVIEEFLTKFDLDLIVRGHQVVEDGYEFYCNRKLITLFSAPHYCGSFDNAGGVFCLSKDNAVPEGSPPVVEGSFVILQPDFDLPNQWAKIKKKKKKD